MDLGTEEIKALSRQAIDPSEEQVGREISQNLRMLMHLVKTGVRKPRAQYKSVTTRFGKKSQVDTTLQQVKESIVKGF